MWALLAFIGLAFLLWKASKGLKRLGNWMTRVGDSMVDYSVIIQKRNKSKRETAQDEVKKVSEQIRKVKGEENDNEYRDKIREEIKRLTET